MPPIGEVHPKAEYVLGVESSMKIEGAQTLQD